MTDAPLLLTEHPNDVVQITLNRPRARNAVSFEMWEAFGAQLDRLERDTPKRAVVICGADNWFSNGGDMKIPPARGAGAQAPAARLEMGQRIIQRLRALPIPMIAAVEGGAYGIGWSLALACDMIVAAEDAKFGAPFVQFGLVPDGGAAWFLTRQLGRQRAAEIIFSGRTLGAAEAMALGLVSRLARAGQAINDALALAVDIGAGNRHAVEMTKRLLQVSDTSDLAGSHALELAYCVTAQGGAEVARAREAFAQKRPKG